ncbi:proteasome subunit beta type-3 [Caerostris extrusa]|uniref:Proteasome subunit beta n=1 Tax=Caerostris extrusa TaxID=172846 RepID=A0AAV4TI71_CAEEX|nr:proteasome subunit beta type-3 [Caerostris extrusa]
MSILEYNGGIIIAMKGKECVAIAADRRLGVRAQTVAMDFQKIYEMGPRLYIGLPGLATDTASVAQKLKFRLNIYELREGRQMTPKVFSSVVSNLLYEKKVWSIFYVPNDYVLSGTCDDQAHGMCEALWEPDLIMLNEISTEYIKLADKAEKTTTPAVMHDPPWISMVTMVRMYSFLPRPEPYRKSLGRVDSSN